MKNIIILFAIITVTHCFTLPFFKARHLSMRELLDEGIKEKVCSNMGDYEDINKTNLDAYVKEINFEESSARELVIGLLTEGEVEGIKDVLSDVAIWVVMIVLAGIILISKKYYFIIIIAWPIFICCCTVGCCCFNKNVKAGWCGFIYYVIAMALYFGVVVSSIVGFTSANKFVHSFNGSTCSLINFIYHNANGEEKEELPKWIGTTNIVNVISDLTEPIDTIDDDYTTAFGPGSDYNNLATTVPQYKTKIDAISTLNRQTQNNGPSGAKVTPIFSKDFTQNTGKNYNAIQTEYTAYIKSAAESTKDLQESAEQIVNGKGDGSLQQTLQGFQTDFTNIEQTITGVASPVLDNLIKIRDKAFDIFLLAFKILYGIFVAFSAILMALLTLYALIKCFLFKIPVHIIWNLVMLICILTLIVGSLLGIISYIFGAISPVLTYLLSKEYLSDPSSLFKGKGDAANYIDVCLNGDGDLVSALHVLDGVAKYIEEFTAVSRVIESLTSALPNESAVYKSILKELEEIKADLSKATDSTYGVDDVTAVLKSINQLTNGGTCGTTDYYTVTTCPSGYTKKNLFVSPPTGKNCYHLGDVFDNTGSSFSPSYTTQCSSQSTDIKNKIKYILDLYQLLEGTVGAVRGVQTECDNLLLQISNVYQSTSGMTSSMLQVANSAVGPDSDLFSMFNCNFLSHDLIQFVNQFHNKFTKSCRDIGISCLCGSFFSYIGVYILLRAMYHYSPQAKKNAKKDKQNTQISTEIVEIKPKK